MLGLDAAGTRRRARDLGGGAEAHRLRLAREHRGGRVVPARRVSAGAARPAGDPLARRRWSPRAIIWLHRPTSGGCSTAPRTASAAGPCRRRTRDAHRRARRGQLGHDPGQSARAARATRCASGPTKPRWWRRSTASMRTRCSCPACRSRRGLRAFADAARGGRRRAKSSSPRRRATRSGAVIDGMAVAVSRRHAGGERDQGHRDRHPGAHVAGVRGVLAPTSASPRSRGPALPPRWPGPAHRRGGRRPGRGHRAGRPAGLRHRRRSGCTRNLDVVGVELGGALKNVIAIAAGIAEGLGMGHNPRAALITRGLAEITRLGVAMGADPLTFAGLAGMGDLVLTTTGQPEPQPVARRRVGARGRRFEEYQAAHRSVAEGANTSRAGAALGRQTGHRASDHREGLRRAVSSASRPGRRIAELMARELKSEQWR